MLYFTFIRVIGRFCRASGGGSLQCCKKFIHTNTHYTRSKNVVTGINTPITPILHLNIPGNQSEVNYYCKKD